MSYVEEEEERILIETSTKFFFPIQLLLLLSTKLPLITLYKALSLLYIHEKGGSLSYSMWIKLKCIHGVLESELLCMLSAIGVVAI